MENLTIEKPLLNFKRQIMAIIESAKRSLRKINIEQWSGKYPSGSDIENDIKNDNALIIRMDSNIVGYLCIEGESKDYKNKSCNWSVNTNNYISIHRFAIDMNYQGKGISKLVTNYIIKLYLNKGYDAIRIDTHYANIPMIKLLEHLNFDKCGELIISNGDEKGQIRVCYEYNLNKSIS